MHSFDMRVFRRAFVFGGVTALFLAAAPAQAQDAVMKACGEQWQAAKASGTSLGVTWPVFLAECRAAQAQKPVEGPGPVSAPKRSPMPKPEPAAQPNRPAGTPKFPTKIEPQFADLRPSQARQKTCSAQYQANKADGGNAGLKWREKGGGYWSLCNQRLKSV